MGNQVTVIIRTDGLGEIKANAQEFVDNLYDAIQRIGSGLDPEGIDISAGCHANPARVVELHHADGTTIIAAGGSTAKVIGHIFRWRWPYKWDMYSDFISAIAEHQAHEAEPKKAGTRYIVYEAPDGTLECSCLRPNCGHVEAVKTLEEPNGL